MNGVAFRCLSQYQNSDESLSKTSGVLLGIDRTLFYLCSDPPGPPPTLFHFSMFFIPLIECMSLLYALYTLQCTYSYFYFFQSNCKFIEESLIDVLGVSDDSRFASVVLRNGLVIFYDITCTEGPREIFRFVW